MNELDTFPTLCGSVAGKASKLGVALHEAGYTALGLDYRYVAVGTNNLSEALGGFRALRFRGFGVSMPYKTEILKHLDETSEEVLAIGACNTVVQDNGRLIGYNTDWRGAIDALAEVGITAPRSAVIIGAGGVARAIAYGLKTIGCQVSIASRNLAAGAALCEQLGLAQSISIDRQLEVDVDLIVNATPVATGAKGVVEISSTSGAKALLDVVFSPKETALSAQAKQSGLVVASGWRMLLHQALHQFQLYTGKQAPIQPMSKILENALG